jgi:hypothetical protein
VRVLLDRMLGALGLPVGRPVLRRGRVPGIRTLKTTAAAVLAYVAARYATDDAAPVLAALTALLVVQLTLYETVRSGVQRVLSVVAGVLVAVSLATYVGLHWWSLAVVVLVSLVVGKLLRLGPQLLEVPISAMLVLAVGGREAAAVDRVWETLIGAGVGMAVNAVIAPPVYVQPAGAAIAELADRMAGLMRRVASGLVEEWSLGTATRWTESARELAHEVARVDRVLGRGEQSVRLNPRGRRSQPALPSLRAALTVFEHCSVAVRGLCRALSDRAETTDGQVVPDDALRRRLAELLEALAVAVEAFGRHATYDVTAPTAEGAEIREALGIAHERRSHLMAVLAVDPVHDPTAWGLHGAIVANVDRLLRELDLEAGTAARDVARTAVPRRRDVVLDRIASRRRDPAWEPGE